MVVLNCERLVDIRHLSQLGFEQKGKMLNKSNWLNRQDSIREVVWGGDIKGRIQRVSASDLLDQAK